MASAEKCNYDDVAAPLSGYSLYSPLVLGIKPPSFADAAQPNVRHVSSISRPIWIGLVVQTMWGWDEP